MKAKSQEGNESEKVKSTGAKYGKYAWFIGRNLYEI